MAFKIIWSELARADLESIVLFIAHDEPSVAESFGYLLISKMEILAQFPRLGRVVSKENDETIREIVFRPYRIIYRVLTERHIIAIAQIWQGARGEPELSRPLDF
ncbi:MAG TPA: type II toxin-antitoxin system RelE/ParE family toxin [Verrucomicrobiae bacterium]|nr:type II toxin-antitoxin system RelE/ParE family toxin [Verrucomicrobiae bacterium]